VLKQWDILERRLSGQQYVALHDRPTIADLSFFPFAMPWMFQFFGEDIDTRPHILDWTNRMLQRPAVRRVMARGPTIGH
jgi:glutathione S-transferase